MNFEINTKEKTIRLIDKVSITELIEFMRDSFKDWREYTISPSNYYLGKDTYDWFDEPHITWCNTTK